MTEEKKYYVPQIKEFHAGFLYYYNVGTHFELMSYSNNIPYEEMNPHSSKSEIKVKYLDKEDIESLGFIKDVERSYGEHRDCFNKLNYCIDFYFNDYNLIIKKFDSEKLDSYNTRKVDILFNGKIKNISELKVLLKQLNIL